MDHGTSFCDTGLFCRQIGRQLLADMFLSGTEALRLDFFTPCLKVLSKSPNIIYLERQCIFKRKKSLYQKAESHFKEQRSMEVEEN